MADLPTGTVTFLLTDIESSTALWDQDPEAMRPALARHDALFEAAIRDHGGAHIRPRGEGDSRFAVFPGATSAAEAALTIQRSLMAEAWATPRPIRVRIGLHTGEALLREDDYYGAAVNRCARIRGLGHGGQILLSEATARLVRDAVPDGALLQELGLLELKDLRRPERVFQLSADDLPTKFPSLQGPDIRARNLPASRGPLIGRDRETDEVLNLLLRPDVGLVTLTGPGGIGKTRLAAQVAAEALDEFADGAYFVRLAPIRDPELVVPAIGKALGVAMDGGRPPLETLKEYVRGLELLLVLDNLEQVVDVGPQLVELLSASETLKMLTTSRMALRVSGEYEYDVPSLELPSRTPGDEDAVATLGESEAVRLFVERAKAVRADFALSQGNVRDVAEICHRLDGLPLAIELAAARARLLSPSAMLARLVVPLGTPSLRLLTGGPRDQPERQQTLRNTIAWSYDLLEPDEQAFFRRLAVFMGGCTIEAAEAASAALPTSESPAPDDVLDAVDSLLAKSLLRHVDGPAGDQRYMMLETVREYGLESLETAGELEALRRWHAHHFLSLAEEAEPELHGPEQGHWLDRLETERHNLRAALEWSLSPAGDPSLALRLSGALCWYWYNRSHIDEARRWVTQSLNQADDSSLARVKALAGAGRLAHIQHDSDQARAVLSEALMLAHKLGDRWWTAWCLHLLGRVSYFDGDAESARAFGNLSLDIAREISDDWLEAWALHLLGLAEQIDSNYPEARRLYEASLVIRQRIDFREGAGTISTLLGLIDFMEGDYSATHARLRDALDHYRGLDAGWLLGNLVAQFLALAAALGQPERAARLWGGLSALSEAVSIRPIPLVEAVLGPALDQTRRALGEERFQSEQALGRRMSLDEVMDLAMSIDILDTPPPTAILASHPDGLTDRELEVLGLIAVGRTTQEIADELVISVNTVERHITHVYQKIGARGRADAAAYAVQHGLS